MRHVHPLERVPQRLSSFSGGCRLALVGAIALSLWACGNPLHKTDSLPAPETDPAAPLNPSDDGSATAPSNPMEFPLPPPLGDITWDGGSSQEPGSQEPPAATAELPTCTGGVMAAFDINANQPPGANSGDYAVPAEARRMAIRGSIDAFLAGDSEGALTLAGSAEYSLCRGTGDEADLVLWRPPVGEGHAVIALRTGPAKPLILEAPHPMFDSGTVEESVVIFKHVKARVLIASMTHRCAMSEESGCDGTTDACGSGKPYKMSDQAHTDSGIFHAAHLSLAEAFSQDIVMQIHRMGRSGISVSNGTSDSTDPSSFSARLTLALMKEFSGVTTCNAFSGGKKESHLCATTNTQGRHVNGILVNACSTSTKAASGRFVHVEQNRSVTDQPEKVAAAIATMFP